MTKLLPKGSHILIICDGSDGDRKDKPIIGGVKRSIGNMDRELNKMGYKTTFIHPFIEKNGKKVFKTKQTFLYKNFELAKKPLLKMIEIIKEEKPTAIFNSTNEGPLGISTMLATMLMAPMAKNNYIPYTASYHTNLDEHINIYLKEFTNNLIDMPPMFTNSFLSFVYNQAYKVLVPTKEIENKVKKLGFKNVELWTRGVDTKAFKPAKPREKNPYQSYKWYDERPILINFGRMSDDKNLEVFLKLKTDKYHKVLIGDGPMLKKYKSKYGKVENIHFLGPMFNSGLEKHIRFSDVHVFPSLMDTFGNVIIEAGASGVPTVAFNVQGPKDVIINNKTGIKIEKEQELLPAIEKALKMDKKICKKETIENYSLEKAAKILLNNLKPIEWKKM